jgi:hypothetical protein
MLEIPPSVDRGYGRAGVGLGAAIRDGTTTLER